MCKIYVNLPGVVAVVAGVTVVERGVAVVAVIEVAVVAVAVDVGAGQPVHVVVLVVVTPPLDRQLVKIGVVDGEGGVVPVQHCGKANK